jgi:hypothetical protein
MKAPDLDHITDPARRESVRRHYNTTIAGYNLGMRDSHLALKETFEAMLVKTPITDPAHSGLVLTVAILTAALDEINAGTHDMKEIP